MITSMHVIGSRYLGGAEMFYIRLVNELHKTSHSVSAITRPNSMVSRELDAGVAQAHAGMFNVRDPVSRYRIGRILRQNEPDIVQTYMGRATRLTHVPKDTHTVHVSRLGGFYKLNGYRHAQAWIGNTRSICDYLVGNGFPVSRVFHIPNFVDDGRVYSADMKLRLRKELGLPEEALAILGVGRLVEKKGFRYLIEAFSRLPETIGGRPVHLLIVGDGPEREALGLLVSQTCPAGRVHWTGWQKDPGPYYELADIFVCPSLHEPLGNVILEAWASSTPVISTRTLGALELLEDGISGLLVPCGDSAVLSRTLLDLIRQGQGAWVELAKEGRSLLKRNYGKEAVVESYLGLYNHLVAVGK